MPIYEYKLVGDPCKFCGDRFEMMQDLDEPPFAACPACATPCKRLISAPRIGRNVEGNGGKIDTANVERNGMARWKKTAPGVYERTAGSDASGPRYLFKDGSTAD